MPTESDDTDHRKATGRRGERLAADHLREKGWRILATNYEKKIGELDVVARRTGQLGPHEVDVVAFVEVKSRATSIDIPTELNVTRRKRRKLITLAKLFLDDEDLDEVSARFDIVTVDLSADPPQLSHYPAAFDALARFN